MPFTYSSVRNGSCIGISIFDGKKYIDLQYLFETYSRLVHFISETVIRTDNKISEHKTAEH